MGYRITAARCAGLVALTTLLLGANAAQAEKPSVTLRGAGASFPAPLYARWVDAWAKQRPDVAVSYESVGSGDGIRRFVAGTVDFGASDAALSDQDIAKVGRGAVLVPGTSGMVVLAYNLPGLAGPLKLPRDVYADILLGKITNWGDPRVRQANPGISLQSRGIALVARLDGSGTTYALTNHLSAVSETWKRERGVGTRIDWPKTAMLARGNEGVSARIKISEGAIGYVEYGFAKRLGLPMAQLQNKAGNYVAPDEPSGQSALTETVGRMGDSMRVFVTDPQAPDAYPVVTYSWLLLYGQYADEKQRAALKEFVAWGLTGGQKLGRELGYIPLPDVVAARGKSALDTIR